MRTRIIGIVLIIVSLGIDAWLGAGLATGSRATGVALGFVLFSLPFLAVGIYLLMSSRGEIKEESKADKERTILNSVMTRGRVSVADLAIEGNLNRDQVKAYIYDLIGKDLFRGYVNWDKGELVSAEAAQIKEGSCPNCGGQLRVGRQGPGPLPVLRHRDLPVARHFRGCGRRGAAQHAAHKHAAADGRLGAGGAARRSPTGGRRRAGAAAAPADGRPPARSRRSEARRRP